MLLRATLRLLSPAMLVLALSCGTDDGPAVPGPGSPVPESPGADLPAGSPSVVVSNAIGSAVPGPGAATSRATAHLAIDGPVVYVSLLPGAIPHGATLTVRNMADGTEVTAAIIDGGVDPVRIAATEGDVIRLLAKDSIGASYTHVAQVKQRAPPRLVRTSPTPAKTDVPLNTIMRVVFSEPVDLATVQSNVRLLQNGVPVAGSVSVVSGNPEIITFAPDSPLAPGATYTLSIDSGVLDLDGDALLAPVTASFTTSVASTPGSAVAKLRVVNASLGGGGDVILDGVTLASNLPGPGASDYLDVQPGNHYIEWRYRNGSLEGGIGALGATAHYTLVGCCVPLADDISAPPEGQVRIRFLQVEPWRKLFLTTPGADLASAVPIPSDGSWVTGYLTVPAGQYQIRITEYYSDSIALDSGPTSFEAGQVRTIVVAGDFWNGILSQFLILHDRN